MKELDSYQTWLLDNIAKTQYRIMRLQSLYNDPTRLNDHGRELTQRAIESAMVELENLIESAKVYIEGYDK